MRRGVLAGFGSGVGVLLVLVIVAAVGLLPGEATARTKRFGQPVPTSPGARAHRHAAISDATTLLDRLLLPAGAKASRTEPVGGGSSLAHPAQTTASGDLVDLHRWWVVPEQPEALSEFFQSHAPAGSRLDLHGTSGFAGEIKSWVVGYEWGAKPDVISSRSLLMEVVALPGGRSGVRADAQEIWLAPSPPADFVPTRTQLLEVEVTISGQEPMLAKRTADTQTIEPSEP